MKKVYIYLLIVFSSLCCHISAAQVQFGTPKNISNSIMRVTSFEDYYPVGQMSSGHYEGILDEFLNDFKNYANFSTETYHEGDYITTIRRSIKGRADIILGIYADTSLYADLKYIYPAAFDNPVHLVMLPSNAHKIKKIDDLKELKGAIDSREYWSDFVNNQLSNFKLEKFDNSQELYAKLMSGEIDYIFTTYWYGSIEMMKLGIYDLVTISKKSIWGMPVFIGISKASYEKDYLSHNLTQWLSKPEVTNKIKQRAISILKATEEKYRGTVPLTYTSNNPNN